MRPLRCSQHKPEGLELSNSFLHLLAKFLFRSFTSSFFPCWHKTRALLGGNCTSGNQFRNSSREVGKSKLQNYEELTIVSFYLE